MSEYASAFGEAAEDFGAEAVSEVTEGPWAGALMSSAATRVEGRGELRVNYFWRDDLRQITCLVGPLASPTPPGTPLEDDLAMINGLNDQRAEAVYAVWQAETREVVIVAGSLAATPEALDEYLLHDLLSLALDQVDALGKVWDAYLRPESEEDAADEVAD